MFARALDRLLDLLWDATELVGGTCAVCAFWRGLTIGLVAGGLYIALRV